MKTLPIICVSGSLLPMLSGCSEKVEQKNEPINVIYILCDDLGYGDLGCYGQTLISTPHLDQMAAEGMLFRQHYAGCTVSAPSRASLMTGFHTGHTQIRGNREVEPEGQMPMDAGTYTLGKLFKSQEYATGIFGKWGLGYPGSSSDPNAMGFDEFYGYNCQRQAHTYYPEHVWRNRERVVFEENENLGRKIYSHDLIHQEALNFIRTHKEEPFFAMLTYTLPHAEINLPHDSIYKLYEGQFEETVFDQPGGYYRSEKPRASFAAMVARLDMYVGEIMQELKAQGLDKNTMVFFTSDNGPHEEGGADPVFFRSSGPLKGIKRDLYEGGIRIPMIAWAPGKIKSGTETDHISAFWDMMPTFADLLGTPLPGATDGISFLPTLLSTNNQQEHPYLYWEFHEQGGRQALRQGKWKLIRQGIHSDQGMWHELYDLETDIHEDHNLADLEPGKVRELIRIMDAARTESEMFNFGR
ncbi:MAG: arylsulfatase [Tannerellaceae bacterium]|nr:arylsulfatase [Tannerellaceae bacterium]